MQDRHDAGQTVKKGPAAQGQSRRGDSAVVSGSLSRACVWAQSGLSGIFVPLCQVKMSRIGSFFAWLI